MLLVKFIVCHFNNLTNHQMGIAILGRITLIQYNRAIILTQIKMGPQVRIKT